MTPPGDVESTPQNEVDAVRWIARRLAPQTLSYARDVDMVGRVCATR